MGIGSRGEIGAGETEEFSTGLADTSSLCEGDVEISSGDTEELTGDGGEDNSVVFRLTLESVGLAANFRCI